MVRSRKVFLALVGAATAVLVVGNTHRILPAESGPCQLDISHVDHVKELPMFHCIGHTEYVVAAGEEGPARVAAWDHLHPWMTLDRHLEHGFTEAHAIELIERAN